MKPKKQIQARVDRIAMCGGGTAYSVYFRCADKPSRPLHGGFTYATEILSGDGGPFYAVVDAIDPRSHWGMEQGWAKYEEFKKLERIAKRLTIRIAKRAFSELRGLRELPALWATWSLPRAEKWISVNITLPE